MSELTAELIVDQNFPQDVQIAPDGKHVAYILAPSGKKEEHETSAIWIASTDHARETRQFTAGEAHDRHPRWSPDGKHLAFLSDRARRGTAQLYLIAADGGEALALTSIKNKKSVDDFTWSPGGGQLAFTSADEPTEEGEKERDDARVYGEKWPHARLRLLLLATKEITTLAAGERHIADFTWHPQGTEIAYVVQQTPDLEARAHEVVIERIAIAGGEPQVVCHFPCAIHSLTWSQDGSTLFFLAPVAKKSQSSTAVHAVPAQGGEPTPIACSQTNCAAEVRAIQQVPSLAILIGEGLGSRIDLLDPKKGGAVTLLGEMDGERAVEYDSWDVRRSEDGTLTVAVVRSAGDQPREMWAGQEQATHNARSIAMQQISNHQGQFAGIAFGKQEPFFWTASDGLELDGILIRPAEEAEASPLPMVVLVHGGPYGRWGQEFHVHPLDWGQWLALAGYVVLMPNPRGGFGHGEQFAAAARGEVGQADYQDVIAAVDTAIARGIADPERLGIGGWSQGGFMSAWAVTQTARFKAAVMGAGVSDWGMMIMTSDVPDFEQELGGSAPWDGPAQRRHLELSPITFARNVSTPVLMLHGENDARVPLSQATGFHRALRKQGVPVEFVVYPREPHGVAERAHQIDILKRVRRWYDRWLKG